MASPYLYSTPIVGQTFRQGHLWPRGTASFARPLPPKGRGRPRASLLGPRQSDLRRIHFSAVKDALRSVHWQVYPCPVSVQFADPPPPPTPPHPPRAPLIHAPPRRATTPR